MAATNNEGGLWRPANEAEEVGFAHKWCVHCLEMDESVTWEDEFGNEVPGTCGILERACYMQTPHELKIRDGQPHCTAFREDPANPARCPKTMEMFT